MTEDLVPGSTKVWRVLHLKKHRAWISGSVLAFGFLFPVPTPVLAAEHFSIPIPDHSAEAQNMTREYQALILRPTDELDANSVALLNDSKVLLVPGFLSNAIRALKDLPVAEYFGLGEYFGDILHWLAEHKIDYQWADIESEATCEDNAKIITAAIQASTRPVVIVSHSKGGLDVLEALIEHPEILPKIRGWISLNSPFQGTPLANAFLENNDVRWAVGQAMHWMGGTEKSIEAMTVEKRLAFNQQYADEIQNILKSIPLIAVSAWIANRPRQIDTALEMSRDYILHQGYINDGAVPWVSAFLKSTSFVTLAGIDHTTTVNHTKWVKLDRLQMHRALFTLLAQRIGREAVNHQLLEGQTFTR